MIQNSFTIPLKPIIGRESPAHVTLDVFLSQIRMHQPRQPLAEPLANALDQLAGGFQSIFGSLAKGQILTVQSPWIGSMVQEQMLTGDLQITPASDAKVGASLVVVLTQDAVGGHNVTWSPTFHNAPVISDTTANTLSIYTFIGRLAAFTPGHPGWFLQCTPLFGQAK